MHESNQTTSKYTPTRVCPPWCRKHHLVDAGSPDAWWHHSSGNLVRGKDAQISVQTDQDEQKTGIEIVINLVEDATDPRRVKRLADALTKAAEMYQAAKDGGASQISTIASARVSDDSH